MTFYCPLNKPDAAIELARDETWKVWQDIVDGNYIPDGITVTTTIKKVGNHYIIDIR